MTIHVKGRGRHWVGCPQIEICLPKNEYVDDEEKRIIFALEQGNFEARSRETGEFIISSTHANATDVEEDSSYVFQAKVFGVTFPEFYGPFVEFHGFLTEVAHYEDGFDPKEGDLVPDVYAKSEMVEAKMCTDCEEPHLFLPYTPPENTKWKPRQVLIRLRYGTSKEN
jgi:hypothetical protein